MGPRDEMIVPEDLEGSCNIISLICLLKVIFMIIEVLITEGKVIFKLVLRLIVPRDLEMK